EGRVGDDRRPIIDRGRPARVGLDDQQSVGAEAVAAQVLDEGGSPSRMAVIVAVELDELDAGERLVRRTGDLDVLVRLAGRVRIRHDLAEHDAGGGQDLATLESLAGGSDATATVPERATGRSVVHGRFLGVGSGPWSGRIVKGRERES